MNGSIAVFTSGRQDWSILKPVVRELAATGSSPFVVAGGLHVRDHDGHIPSHIDEYPIAATINACADGSTGLAAAHAAGETMSLLADLFTKNHLACLIIVGDRSETLAAAQAALLIGLPIVHLHGGEISLGAIDNRIRHAISQLADLHCVATRASAERLIQFGIPQTAIVVSGAPGLDALFSATSRPQKKIREAIGLKGDGPLVLLTYHPATAGEDPTVGITACCDGLDIALESKDDVGVIATAANNDAGGLVINNRLREWCARHPERRKFVTALGADYHPTLLAADLMLGNSSSGIIEAPAAGLPVINVGRRQEGREREPAAIVDVAPDRELIAAEILKVISPRHAAHSRQPSASRYGDGHAASRIATAICARFLHAKS